MEFKPGRHPDLTAEEYHLDPCPTPSLSSHIAHILIERSPRHAWTAHPRLNPAHKPKNKKEFDIGKAAHALMLGDGRVQLHIVEAPTWQTKAAKSERDRAYRMGDVPILRKDADRVAAMVNAGRAQLEDHQDMKQCFTDGAFEQVIAWQELTADGPIWCRAMLDWFPRQSRLFPDYKTTSGTAHPDSWSSSAWDMGYGTQAAFYLRGLRRACNIHNAEFRFVTQETEPPYALSVCGFDPEALAGAEADVESAIQAWGWCTRHDKWPGYPNYTGFVEIPGWAKYRREKAAERIQLAIDDGRDIKELMLNWQAPL